MLTASKFSRVYIEISNICNLQCDFCPEVERGKKIMSQSLFEAIIDQVQPLTEEVTFHLMGEPLAHPQFSEFVAYCEKQSVPVNITTNGTLLTHKSRVLDLLSPSIRQVNFSLQSFTSNFPNQEVAPYLENIFDFTKRAFIERPDLYINYRLWNITADQHTKMQAQQNIFLEPILREFAEREWTFEAAPKINHVDVAFKKSINIKNRLYLHFDSRFEWPSLKAPISSEKGHCYGLKSHFAIHADGTVVPCCLDKEAGLALGRVTATQKRASPLATQAQPAEAVEALTVLEALNSQRARNLREGFNQFELREELCKRCTFIRRFDRKVNRSLKREVTHDNTLATLGP